MPVNYIHSAVMAGEGGGGGGHVTLGNRPLTLGDKQQGLAARARAGVKGYG